MTSPYDWQQDNLILRCHIQPNASRNEIVGLHEQRLKIRIAAPPVDGKANEQIIKWFAKLFKVPKSHIDILHGESGRQKTLRIKSPQHLPEFITSNI